MLRKTTDFACVSIRVYLVLLSTFVVLIITVILRHYCSLPLWRVHEIKHTYLASRIHGLFITLTQFFISTTYTQLARYVQDWHLLEVQGTAPLITLLTWKIPPLFLIPSYVLGIPPLRVARFPSTLVPGCLCTDLPPFFLPIPLFPFLNGSLF
jgi:hypothetical protein